MAANIATLLKKAEASPAVDMRHSRWVALAPVVETLLGKGHSVWTAVRWLVTEGAIPDESKRTAYHAILQHRNRAKK